MKHIYKWKVWIILIAIFAVAAALLPIRANPVVSTKPNLDDRMSEDLTSALTGTMVTIAVSETTGADQEIVAKQGAGTQIWIYSIMGTMTSAGTLKFHHDAGPTDLTASISLDANGGFSYGPGGTMYMPIWKCGTDAGFDVDVSAGTFNGTMTYMVVTP